MENFSLLHFDFFQSDKNTGEIKGIVAIELGAGS
jgi:hypothetical protein